MKEPSQTIVLINNDHNHDKCLESLKHSDISPWQNTFLKVAILRLQLFMTMEKATIVTNMF